MAERDMKKLTNEFLKYCDFKIGKMNFHHSKGVINVDIKKCWYLMGSSIVNTKKGCKIPYRI